MKITATIVLVYSLFLITGGLVGYLKGGSSISLITGSLCGFLLLASAYLISKGRIFAQYLALGLTFLLDIFFTYRFAKTLHFFPSGFASLLSLSVLIVIALKIRKTIRFN